MSDEIKEEFSTIEGTISEMGAFDTTTHPNLSIPTEFLETVKKSDDDPMFVTVEVKAGRSRNRRNWKPEHLKKVVDKVNKERMSGNLGHPLLDEKEYGKAFPIPQVAWAVATMEGDRAIFKGYVLKKSQARDLLPLGLIDGVSVFGPSRMRPTADGYEIIDFTPETIDFARKGSQGMQSRVLSLTGEMNNNERGFKVEPREIAALSVAELREHAPLAVKAIQDEALKPVEEKIGEQTALVADLQPQVDVLGEIKKLLKLQDGDNVIEKVTALLSAVEDASASDVKAYIKELIGKKTKSTRGQALVARLIGEMHQDYAGQTLDADLKKTIETDFTAKVDGDEDIKGLIGEMGGADENRGRNGGKGGFQRRANSDERREDERNNGSLRISTRKFGE